MTVITTGNCKAQKAGDSHSVVFTIVGEITPEQEAELNKAMHELKAKIPQIKGIKLVGADYAGSADPPVK